MTHGWPALLFAALLSVATPVARAQEAPEGEGDAPPPEGPPPPPPDAPIGPPPPPPEQSTYPAYPGQPAVGYDATASAGGAAATDDVVPVGEPPAPEEEKEHRGFFLRPHVGFGFLGVSGQGTQARGLAVGAGIKIGAAIAKNFILFGEFTFQIVDSADYDGPILPAPGDTVGLTMVMFGGGIAYYLMPLNLHASLSASFLAMQVAVGDTALLTDPAGFGLHLTVGKEWMLGRRWGLGIAAHSVLGFANDYTLYGVGLAATLTFN